MFGTSRKDAAFYDAFRQLAELAHASAQNLADLLDHPAGGPEPADALRESRDKAVAIRTQTVRLLHGTWITPLDRHQIHGLVTGLDGIISLIHSTVSRIGIFAFTEGRDDARALAHDVVECCQRLQKATQLLPKLKKEQADKVMALAGEIHELERKADETWRSALGNLLEGETDPLAVMKWRDILDSLEITTNRCRDVADLFEGVVLENA